MNQVLQDLTLVVLIGVGATAVMDAWLLLLKQLKVPTLNFALVGRWIGHSLSGRWKHEAIARAEPIKGELALGWLLHYGVGIAFAGVLVSIFGMAWAGNPSLVPALLVGAGTVVAPLFVMQPAMGSGIASSKTAAPIRNSFRSLANHTVFGVGLYFAAASIEWIAR
jgi:Protein of unknown function (DUF2938)